MLSQLPRPLITCEGVKAREIAHPSALGNKPIALEKGLVPMTDFIADGEHEITAILAYRLWERRGRPLGSPEVDWFEAKNQLARELAQGDSGQWRHRQDQD